MRWVIILVLFFIIPVYADRVIGYIKDKDKKPIADVTVELQNSYYQREALYTTTNSNGFFAFVNLKPDTYRVKAEKFGWITWVSPKVILKDSNDKQKLIVVMSPAPMSPIDFVHLCCLLVAMIAGYFTLIFNFFIAPIPSRSITLTGWIIILVALVSSFSLNLFIASVLTLAALPVSIFITSRGKVYKEDAIKQEKEVELLERAIEEEHNKLGYFIGKTGTTTTDLKPCGNLTIVIEVKSKSGFIPKDTSVVIKDFENGQLVVEKQ